MRAFRMLALGLGPATVHQTCGSGCVVAPAGSDDYCAGNGGTGFRLPYACGATYTCSNGNNTSSHSGTDQYAYDFAMSVGTSIRAVRAGVVHRVRIVSTPGSDCYNGGGSGCANLANTVEVRHSDGTIGLYMHISTNSVSTGQTVNQGQEVAKSGNTGWSTGPHLHLQVQSNCGIWWCQSQSFSFVEAPSLSADQAVTSQNCP
jgi:murein DD-endopeptidase MepM/ murein hydrolase activator NlpD